MKSIIRNILREESENKKSDYVSVIEEIVELYKEDDCICDIDVSYDEEDDMYSVYVVTSMEELANKFDNLANLIVKYVNDIRNNIKKDINAFLPIENIYVGSYGKPNCDWDPVRRINEETEGMSPLEQTVAEFVNMNLSEYNLPEDFDRVAVDIYSDGYGGQECIVTSLFKKPFTLEESDMLHNLMRTIKKSIEEYFGNTFSYVRGSTSTVDNYMGTKWWYDEKKNKNINESKERPNKEVIINIINELILPNYKDDICSVEYIDKDERLDLLGKPSFNQSRLTITFIGKRPERFREKDKYDEIMNDIWHTLYDYSGVAADLYARYVDKCEKENINESVMGPEYLDLIKDIVEIYKHEDFVCDIEVSYDDEDGMYSIMITFDSEELLKIRDRGAYARQIRNSIGEEIVKYIPDFLNFYCLSYVRHCKKSINENWSKVPSSEFNQLEKIINLEMKEKYGWWKDIKINTLNYIELYGDVQLDAELTVDEEWGANQWREYHYISEFPGNKGWEDDGYELVRFGDIIDSTYAEVIRDNLREILRYALNIEAYNMSFRNVYLIFE